MINGLQDKQVASSNVDDVTGFSGETSRIVAASASDLCDTQSSSSSQRIHQLQIYRRDLYVRAPVLHT